MAFRLIVSEAADLTTIQTAGRLDDDAVALLGDACGQSRRPLVLDLSDLTSASSAGVLLLRRLRAEGVHILGASRYVTLLLDEPAGTGKGPPQAPGPPGGQRRPPAKPRSSRDRRRARPSH